MIPAVLTRIPSFVSFHEGDDYALWAPEDDPEELGERLLEAIESRSTRQRLSKRGREVAEQFRAVHTGEKLEEFFFDRHQKLAGRPKARERSSMI